MSQRTPLIAGNWKMHKTVAEAEESIAALLPRISTADGVDVGLCAPFTALGPLVDSTRGSRVGVYAQNMHEEDSGAFTGEVSAPMLTELDVHGVVLGHSERRQLFAETDKALARKVPAALAAGLQPILCVGETEAEREAGDTERKLRSQVQEDLSKVDDDRLGDVVIAYEPIWAIGTGHVATPEQAQEAIAFVRALVADRDAAQAERVRHPLRRLGQARERRRADGAARRGRRPGRRGLARGRVAGRDRRRREAMSDGPPQGPGSIPAPSACLIVLDGWGLAEPGPGNAVSLAQTPVFDALWDTYPHTQLTASGPAVGLPEGQMGNSEVGHLNLGAGAVVKQDLTRIDEAVEDGSLSESGVLSAALRDAERVHLIGLVSDGGVHSGWKHIEALIGTAGEAGVPDVVLHAFTDGRDTPPKAGAGYLQTAEAWCAAAGNARVGSVIGRYFAMDRDQRWERTQRAYDLLVAADAPHRAATGHEAVELAYERGETDEFVEPTLVGEEARIRPGDSVIAFNFRPDRMRQITRALADPGFEEIDRRRNPPVERYTTMTEYHEDWDYPVAFSPERPEVTIAKVIADTGAGQLHGAETEKYAHVTYFFNGGEEHLYPGEERVLVPSPRDVPTYDLKPEMSAPELAGEFAATWREHGPRFGVINFANADMVGHTGVIPAAVKAVETVDAALGEVVAAVHESGGVCIVTADHGNADKMLEPDGSPHTAHTLNPVPFIVTSPAVKLDAGGGILADVAPTILALLGIDQPAAMTGRSLARI